MSDITASMVKELREKTGAGMMDAKGALVENKGDMEAAVDWLRKKGLAKAAKKSSRTAAEGLVALAVSGTRGAVVEVNSETDFVARNDQFQDFARTCGEIALNKVDTVEQLSASDYGNGKTVQETLTNMIATIGENMALRRMGKLEVTNGIVAGYIHNAVSPGLGKIGVLVALESTGDKDKLSALGRQIAMHTAAAFPQYLHRDHVDTSHLDREKDVIRGQAKQQGKTDEVIEKMLEGRVRKFFEEVVLLEQIFVVDGETKVHKILENAAKDVGAPVELAGYIRMQLGEGIEKEVTDFAAEVAAAVNG
jgi:elongation factor Ts